MRNTNKSICILLSLAFLTAGACKNNNVEKPGESENPSAPVSPVSPVSPVDPIEPVDAHDDGIN